MPTFDPHTAKDLISSAKVDEAMEYVEKHMKKTVQPQIVSRLALLSMGLSQLRKKESRLEISRDDAFVREQEIGGKLLTFCFDYDHFLRTGEVPGATPSVAMGPAKEKISLLQKVADNTQAVLATTLAIVCMLLCFHGILSLVFEGLPGAHIVSEKDVPMLWPTMTGGMSLAFGLFVKLKLPRSGGNK